MPKIPKIPTRITAEQDFYLSHPELDQKAKEKKAQEDKFLADLAKLKPTKRTNEAEKLLTSEIEKRIGLKEQYNEQINLLTKTGLIKTLPSGKIGIIGIDNKEYPLPTYENVRSLITPEKDKILTQKAEQGFNQLLIVPYVQRIDNLIDNHKQTILKHHKAGKLLSTNEDRSTVKLELDESQPVWVWNEYQNADIEGKLIYYPKQFSDDHQGLTKQQLINQQTKQGNPCLGYHILLIENLPNLPAEGKGKTIGGSPSTRLGARKQIEANQSSNQYLEITSNPETDVIKNPYIHEQGLTPEDWLTYAITHLEKSNYVIDDYQGQGKACFLTGSFLAGKVPLCCWYRSFQQAELGRDGPGGRVSRDGFRAAVKI